MYVTNTAKTVEKKTGSGKSIWWLLSEEDGAPNFELRYIEIEKGGKTSGTPHPWEHEIYVSKGNGRIRGDDVDIAVTQGDAVLVLPNEKHELINTGEDVFGFICVIPKGSENLIK